MTDPASRATAPRSAGNLARGAVQPADADLRVHRIQLRPAALPAHQPAAGLAAHRGRGPEGDRPVRADRPSVHVEVPVVAAARPLRAAVARPPPRLDVRDARRAARSRSRRSGFLRPQTEIWTIAYLAAAVAFFSASLDIAMDAFRRELLPDAELGLGNSIYVNAYRISSLVPGSLALILADRMPWSSVFVITALFMLPGLVMTLVVREPAATAAAPKTLRDAVVAAVPRVHRPRRAGRTRCWSSRSSSSTSSATAWRRRSPRRSTSTWASPRPRSASSPRTRGCGRA